MAFSLGKVSLGTPARKRYNHNMGFDNSTTFSFGAVQPLMCHLMMANSDIKVSYRQLVRLAPLVAPSFARMHLQNEVSFVSLPEVVPYFEAMQSRMPYSVGNKTYKPVELPTTTNAFLVYMLLVGNYCKYTYWQPTSTAGNTPASSSFKSMKVTDANVAAVQLKLFTALGLGSVSAPALPTLGAAHNLHTTDITDVKQDYVTFESADFVFVFSDGFAMTFRLNNAARRVRKIFVGCGYSLNMSDSTPLSFAPLLAFYKAWFDLYAVRRTRTWNTTNCFAIIKYIEDNYYTKFLYGDLAKQPTAFVTLVTNFFVDLRNCWYVYKDDFVSVHRTDTQLVGRSVNYIGALHSQNTVRNTVGDSTGDYGDPYVVSGTSSPNPFLSLTNVGLQTIQRLSRFVNKDSVIGQRMSQWLRVHYGADVVNSVFKDANHVSSSRLDLQVNDVMSTSDTAQGEDENRTGEVLGAYAGKGLGFQKSGFKFHANSFGYIFVMSAIVPESGYFQGNDTSLYGINNDTLPNPDFDALGMELTPQGAIASDNNILVQNATPTLTDKSFGYIPRFSGFKVKKNIVNGDMSRRGTISSMCPYYLDRILTSSTILSEQKVNGAVVIGYSVKALPVASEEWRYCAAYPWLGNYDRLFYQSGKLYKGGSSDQRVDFGNPVDDNFLCQTVFDVRVTNCLKPISDSYDTYEEGTDKGSVDVLPE